MDEPTWLSKDLIVAIHQRQLGEHGGLDGIRDAVLLESALAMPRNLRACEAEADLPGLASAYAFGIARNHAFLDGNKRTAYVACRTFLKLNWLDLRAPAVERYTVFLRLAEGDLSREDLAHWLRQNTASA